MNTYPLKDKISLDYRNRSGIYLILVSHHKYVGSTKNIYDRIQTHRKQLRANKAENKKFIAAYNKYTEDSCYWQVLEYCDSNDETLKLREKYWIEKIDSDLNINRDPTKYPSTIIYNSECSSKKVYQYDLDGNFIKEFPSASEAERTLGIDGNSITQVCRKIRPFVKSAGGYQWSYTYETSLPKYINNSSKAKIKGINIFDVISGEEYSFDSIADAVRALIKDSNNFDSDCASLSSATKVPTYAIGRYLCKSLDSPYYRVPSRNKLIYDSINDVIYMDSKEASDKLGISRSQVKKICKDESNESLQYLNYCARVKFRESGKLHLLDNPNPSSVEIQ